MATLYITEHAKLASTLMGAAPGRMVAEQTIAIGGAAVASSAFNAATRIIRVHTDATCSIAIASAPIATAVMPTTTVLNLGTFINTTTGLNGTIQEMAFAGARLTNARMQTLTT